MAIGEITEKYYISPKEAVTIIGRKSFDEWNDNLLEDAKNPLVISALKNLYKALQSGKVAAYTHSQDGFERRLNAVEAANDFFRIDLKIDACFDSAVPVHLVQLKIRKDALEKYLKAIKHKHIGGKISDETSCQKWLTNLFQEQDNPPIKDELYRNALTKFPSLSKRAFTTIRNQAAKSAGKPWLLKGGRPKQNDKT